VSNSVYVNKMTKGLNLAMTPVHICTQLQHLLVSGALLGDGTLLQYSSNWTLSI